MSKNDDEQIETQERVISKSEKRLYSEEKLNKLRAELSDLVNAILGSGDFKPITEESCKNIRRILANFNLIMSTLDDEMPQREKHQVTLSISMFDDVFNEMEQKIIEDKKKTMRAISTFLKLKKDKSIPPTIH